MSSNSNYVSPIVDITEYLKSIDIFKAWEAGVDIYSVQVIPGMYNEIGKILAANIELWLKNEPDLIKHKTSVSKTEKYHGERFTTYDDTYYFSKFKLSCHISDGQMTRITFDALSEKELLTYSQPDTLATDKKTPSLLQIAFGILKKYPSLNANISIYRP